MASYRDRVLRDLKAWREAGWVTDESAAAIAAALPQRRSIGFSAIVGMLGALLVAAGVIAFIAANWDDIPRLMRLGIAVAIMAAGCVAAAPLRRSHPLFGEGALLVGAAGFAGLLTLIGQTYSIGMAEFVDVIGLWTAGVVVGALLLASPVMLILAVAGGAVWSAAAVGNDLAVVHLPGLLPIIAGGAIAVRAGSGGARQVATLALAAWIVIAAVGTADAQDWDQTEFGSAVALAGLALLAATLALRTRVRHPAATSLAGAAAWPAVVLALAGLAILQAAAEPAAGGTPLLVWLGASAAVHVAAALASRSTHTIAILGGLIVAAAAAGFAFMAPENEFVAGLIGAAIVIGATVWTVVLGRERLVPGGAPIGLTVFGLEVIYVYAVTIGTILDTSLVFLGGGLLFIALAFGLVRIERRLTARTGDGS